MSTASSRTSITFFQSADQQQVRETVPSHYDTQQNILEKAAYDSTIPTHLFVHVGAPQYSNILPFSGVSSQRGNFHPLEPKPPHWS